MKIQRVNVFTYSISLEGELGPSDSLANLNMRERSQDTDFRWMAAGAGEDTLALYRESIITLRGKSRGCCGRGE